MVFVELLPVAELALGIPPTQATDSSCHLFLPLCNRIFSIAKRLVYLIAITVSLVVKTAFAMKP